MNVWTIEDVEKTSNEDLVKMLNSYHKRLTKFERENRELIILKKEMKKLLNV